MIKEFISDLLQALGEGKFQRSKFHLPMNHEPAMEVDEAGAKCSTCKFYNKDGGGQYGACEAKYYEMYYGTKHIPKPPEKYCSDWYERLIK